MKKHNNIHGILLIDKPIGISSNAVLQKIRHHLGKPKAGHAGTLDPLATGMLPLCFGYATKVNQFLLNKSKCYTATLQFGIQTDTEDTEGKIIAQQDISQLTITDADIDKMKNDFIGKQQQLPPQYSALKHQGKPLYEYARKGIHIDKPGRSIELYHLEILCFNPPYLRFSVHCSKGTYIRSLARDIGKALGTYATLTQLKREWSEPFGNNEKGALPMLTLEECLSLKSEEVQHHLLATDFAIQDLPSISITEQEEIKLKYGQKIALSIEQINALDTLYKGENACRVYNQQHECIAIGELKEGGLKTKQILVNIA